MSLGFIRGSKDVWNSQLLKLYYLQLTRGWAIKLWNMISIHDNFVYGCSLDLNGQRITLHTCYLDRMPHEFTDVVFNGVVAHNFSYILPNSILFDIEEITPKSIVEANVELFGESWRHGWPAINYGGDLALLKNELQNQGTKGFEVQSSYGLCGWVLCKSCERLSRKEVATIN